MRWPSQDDVLRFVVPLVYGRRWLSFGLMLLLTLWLGWHAVQIRADAGFEKQIPLEHPYMQTFKRYEKAFGGANLISIALMRRGGDIYQARFMETLRRVTDEVFFLPGVDRSRVQSLFTPGVRYTEIVEGGFEGGDVVPRDYRPTPEVLAQIRANVARAGIIGRLVAADQRGAMVIAELLERDPTTGERLDYVWVADELEKIRGRIESPHRWQYVLEEDYGPFTAGTVIATRYAEPQGLKAMAPVIAERQSVHDPVVAVPLDKLRVERSDNPLHDPDITVHVIGFAKIIGDVSDATLEVVGYFGLALLMTWLLLWAFCGSFRLSLLPLAAALVAVVWEFGLLHLAGFGLDPFAILVPFLILSIGVSHGVQYINAWANEVAENGLDSLAASIETFRRLAIPGTVAIITDVIGFATISLIQIDIVQEMAINAALGMAAVIVTNKVMLPIVLSWVQMPNVEGFRRRQAARIALGDRIWKQLLVFATPRGAVPTLALSALLLAGACWKYQDLKIGDLHHGVPELRPDSRYNRDADLIGRQFHIGVDLLKVIAEAGQYACVNYPVMDAIDRYTWHAQNTEGVTSAVSLPQLARFVHAAWNEGNPKFLTLPKAEGALAQAIRPIPSSAGLANPDCSAMPVLIFTADHRAETIERLVELTHAFNREYGGEPLNFALASGNLGVMAATNEEIAARELEVVLWVYAVLFVFIFLSFRSAAGIISIMGPLALSSMLTYAFMAFADIGMKSATLPVVALGVGIGVDDGIYLWSVLTAYLKAGETLQGAWLQALRHTGKAVIFTSLALIVSVSTWLLSGLQFQADMGLLLVFMFTSNLFGAVLLLPALAWLTLRVPGACFPRPSPGTAEPAVASRPG